MKKILIIEDEKPVLENIIEILNENDFDAFGAENGMTGVELAKYHLPDLIICDIMMPELDGYGVLNELLKNPATATIPFIFLTAKADKEDLRFGMELGADDYLTKPYTPDQLFRAIDTRLKKHEKIEEKSEQKIEELRINLAASLPHEFRTPLNGILASSQFLLEYAKSLSPEDMTQIIENIFSSAQRLHRLIVNYLFYADMTLLMHDSSFQRRTNEYLVNSPSRIITELFTKKAISEGRIDDLSLSLIDEKIQIKDEHFIKLCDELCDNAFKFSNPGTPIIVSSEQKQNDFIFKVADYGRGMTQEQISKIGAYVQFDRKIYEQQGAGLGLIIIRRITELYKGTLEIDSELSNFTKVKVTLPLAES